MSNLDPDPVKPEKDCPLRESRQTQERPSEMPTHLAQTEQPWSRLHDSATFSSLRRSSMFQDHQPSLDSLDFHLQTVYDHHRDCFLSKQQTLWQKDSVSEKSRHTEKKQEDAGAQQEQEIRRWVDPQRCSIHSIK